MRKVIEWLASGVMIVLAALGALALKDGILDDGQTFYVECVPETPSEDD